MSLVRRNAKPEIHAKIASTQDCEHRNSRQCASSQDCKHRISRKCRLFHRNANTEILKSRRYDHGISQHICNTLQHERSTWKFSFSQKCKHRNSQKSALWSWYIATHLHHTATRKDDLKNFRHKWRCVVLAGCALQHTAQCNTLQFTATNCITVQHTMSTWLT